METLIKLATQYQYQYQSIGDNRTAVQMLDAAVIAIRAAYDPTPRTIDGFKLPPSVPPVYWREEKLEKIAERYQSLHQIRKAEAIERTLPQRVKITIPDGFSRSVKSSFYYFSTKSSAPSSPSLERVGCDRTAGILLIRNLPETRSLQLYTGR